MISDEQLYTLIHTLPGAAHVRTTDTGKYFIVNQLHAINHGFTNIEAATGITYQDIYHHRLAKLESLQGSLTLEAQHKILIERINGQADQAKQPLRSHLCTLFPTGRIHSGLLIKIPILGHTQRVVAVLTFFEDRTHELDLFELYNLYKKHYPIQQAIMQFLKYLNIRQYFKKLPTNQELIILLMLRRNAISKYAARLLGISYRTVEEYKARLRNKLILVNLDKLLVLLRIQREKPFISLSNSISNKETESR
jgi:DNA-binding CsgD family transcriptional regulator